MSNEKNEDKVRFHKAAELGDLETIKRLLENKDVSLDLNSKDEIGMTAFIKAARAGHCELVNYLLSQDVIEPEIVTPDGFSALHLAALNGQTKMVKLLLTAHTKLKVDANVKAFKLNIRPLHFAAMAGSIPVVKLLLVAGADGNILFNENLSALDLAVQEGHHELSMVLDGLPQNMAMSLVQRMRVLGYHSNPKGICFGLSEVGMLAALDSEAALARFYETVFLLKAIKASALMEMKVAHDQIIEQGVKKALTELNVDSESQLTELEKKTVRQLSLRNLHQIRAELPLEQQKQEQQYIDILALFDGMELIQRGGNEYLHLSTRPSLKSQIYNPTWVSPLIRSTTLHQKGGENLITKFIGTYSAEDLRFYFKSLCARIRKNKTINQPVVLALTSPKHALSIVYNPIVDSWRVINSMTMPSNKKELNEQTVYGDLELKNSLADGLLDETGFSILRTRVYAAKNDCAPLKAIVHQWKQEIKPILEPSLEKATFKDQMDNTWLSELAASEDIKTLKSLLQKGANVNEIVQDNKLSVLQVAVYTNRIKAVKFLLTLPGININHEQVDKDTALGIACVRDYTKIVRLLLKSKTIQINTLNNQKLSPLLFAAIQGNTRIVNLLLKDARTNVDLQGLNEATALYTAAHGGHCEVVKSLLKAGADASLKAKEKDNRYYLPMDAAIALGHTEVVSLLLRDAKIKRVLNELNELDQNSQRYLAFNALYRFVLDASNEDEACVLISDFLQLDQQIRAPQCKRLVPSIHKRIQDLAYENYTKGQLVTKINSQFNKAIVTATNGNRLFDTLFFKIPRQNPCSKISHLFISGLSKLV